MYSTIEVLFYLYGRDKRERKLTQINWDGDDYDMSIHGSNDSSCTCQESEQHKPHQNRSFQSAKLKEDDKNKDKKKLARTVAELARRKLTRATGVLKAQKIRSEPFVGVWGFAPRFILLLPFIPVTKRFSQHLRSDPDLVDQD